MTIRRRAGGSAVAAAITLAIGLPALPAAADAGDMLYVDNTNPACSDQGSGTSGQPFCTPSAAAAVVNPGQTVLLAGAGYRGHLTITRSGTPDKPIVFTSSLPGQHRSRTTIGADASVPGPAITVSGAHDVVVQDLRTSSVAEGILVDGSSRITLDHIFDHGLPPMPGTLSHVPGIRLTNGTSATTVSRNTVTARGTAVVLDAGTHDNVVTTNRLTGNNDGGVSATNAPGTVLTSNTLTDRCGPEIQLAGASTGSTVENNILAPASPCSGQGTDLVVSAGSAGSAKADYNIVKPAYNGTGYDWAGTAYPGPAQFTAATGQGRHDSSADPALTGWGLSPAPGSPAIASADPTAPGELDSDLNYLPPVDDPANPNPAGGPAHRDRGAISHQGLYGPGLKVDQSYGAYPFKVTATAGASDLWPSATLSYTFDFGDGSAPVVSATPQADHTYQARGTYRPTVTVTDSFGSRVSALSEQPVTVNEPGPPHAVLGDIHPWTDAWGTTHVLSYQAITDASNSPWPLVSKTVDFGDHTPAEDCYLRPLCIHTYARPGSYTVTLTVKDSTGATDHVSTVLDAAYQPAGFDSGWTRRVLDTRNGTGAPKQQLGPDSELTLNITPPNNTTDDATAVVLNLTAVHPTEPGFLTVYPSGQSRPGTSNSNFTAGQTVAHLVTVPIGSDGNVRIYNHSGSLDVVADIVGLYRPNQNNGFTAITPARVLDTRGHGKVGPREQVCFPIPSAVPDRAQVVLNVTATGADQGTYLTNSPYWDSSILNFGPGQTVANQTVTDTFNRAACLHNWAGHTDVVVDVTGYYAQNSGARFIPVTPARLLDTRTDPGTPLAPGSVTGLQITGRGGIPADATGAVLNLTATNPQRPGYLTAYPGNGTRPGTSSVNFAAGQTVPNHITTGLGPDGQIDLYNFDGTTDAIADVFGYFK